MTKISEYLILEAADPAKLGLAVQTHINQGFQPFGSLATVARGGSTDVQYVQAVVKLEDLG